jgi:alkanesulfonate monooxygenase SsuD/methylene tetrahydromethanopterin reductase-like flavin-dependent oxidoreductase (luciferase family)
MEFSTQWNTHLIGYSVSEFVSVARRAHDLGFQTIWLNDNVRYRNIFTVLTAIAAQVPIKVGTATIVPYFHNPITLACTIASLSDVSQGREVKIGIAIGDLGQTPPYVEFTKRLSMLRESTVFLKQALSGQTAYFRDFPTLVRYFRLNPDGKLKLAFEPAGALPFYGGTLGPKSLAIAGEHMEGIVFPGQFLAFFKTGRLNAMIQTAKDAAARSGPKKTLRFSALLNVSVSKDRKKARQFALPQVAHSVVSLKVAQFTPQDFERVGIDPERVDRLQEAFTSGGGITIEEASRFVDDKMIDAYYLAGTPEEVVPPLIDLVRDLGKLGIDEIAFSKLGYDYGEGLELIAKEVIPHLG